MIISIIICTRNRCEKLPAAINSLETLTVPEGVELEVVIVDNGSTDATAEICKSFVGKGPRSYRYVFEGMRGKSFALNRGLREARGEIFAFTDDDCIVDRTWLEAIMKEYTADPELAFLGGRVELYNEQDKAKSIVTFREQINLSTTPEMVFKPAIIGANMSFKRHVFMEVGEFDVRLGPGSKFSAVAEDLDYLYRAYRKGFKIVYFPNVLIYHDHGRQTDREVEAVYYCYHIGWGAFYCKHLRDIEVVRRLYWHLRWLVSCAASNIVAGKSIRDECKNLRALTVGAMSRFQG